MMTRVRSVTIPVADQDQALRFYTEVLSGRRVGVAGVYPLAVVAVVGVARRSRAPVASWVQGA